MTAVGSDLATPSTSSTTSTPTSSTTSKSKRSSSSSSRAESLCGSLAGATSKFILQPLDLIRTRLQVQDGQASRGKLPQYRGMLDAIPTIIRKEGPLALYTGVVPNIIGSSVAWGCYMYIYNSSKRALKEQMDTDQLSSRYHLVAGMFAGCGTVLITNPIWMVKTRLQLQSKVHTDASVRYKGLLDCVARMFREEGILTFYRGLGPAMAVTSNNALYVMFYEILRRNIKTLFPFDDEPGAGKTLTMGACAKLCSASMTYPLYIMRSRLYQRSADAGAPGAQIYKFSGVRDVIVRTFQREGIHGFYKGLPPHLLKTVPSAALTFTFYEKLLSLTGTSW